MKGMLPLRLESFSFILPPSAFILSFFSLLAQNFFRRAVHPA
jgi:hypothetical protein